MISALSLLVLELMFCFVQGEPGDTTTLGAPLGQPNECGNPCYLTFGLVDYIGPTSTFYTRGYATIPGPTIRVTPGESLHLELFNNLSSNNQFSQGENEYGYLNTTSLHTHGLHVSPAAWSDNVFSDVYPNATGVFSIDIPEKHMVRPFVWKEL
jgi:hypothetical protein